jgi:hypothetical protein
VPALTRALAGLSLAGLTLSCVLALGGCAVPRALDPEPAPGPRLAVEPHPAGLTVEPAQALFHVTLRPGEEHHARATVTNHARTPQRVSMTTVVDRVEGAGAADLDVRVAGGFHDTCPAAPTDADRAARLGSPRGVALGTLDAGGTTSLCGVVALPVDTALPAGTSVTFSVVLAAVEQPADRAAGDDPWTADRFDRTGLTRHALPVAATLGAGALLAAALLLSRRPHRPAGTPEGTPTAPEDLV